MFGVDAEVILIKAVKKHPALYDRSDPDFNDALAKNKIWKSITASINKALPNTRLSSDQCKEYWFNMRNRFRNCLRRRTHKPQLKSLKWVHQENMAFLIPYFGKSRPKSRIHSEDGNNSTKYEEINTADSNSDHFLTEYLVNKLEKQDEDETMTTQEEESEHNDPIVTWNSKTTNLANLDDTDLFFLGLAKDIKVLPVAIRAQLRVDIAEALRDAELSAESGRSGSV